MAEPQETVVPPTAPDLAPGTDPAAQSAPPAPKETPSLTIESIKEQILPELRKELKAAYDAARRAENKADTTKSKFESRIGVIETLIDRIEEKDLPPEQVELHRLKREVERARVPQPDNDVIVREFQARASSVLAEEGIAANDPRLTESFQKHAATATSPHDWDVALARAVSDIHKDEAKKAQAAVKDVADKTREEERAKLLNQKRQDQGPIDKGTPASAGRPKSYLEMSEEEWKASQATGRR